MKLKKLLALTLTGAVLTASLTACTPLDAAELVYDSIFGGGSSSTGSTGSGNTGSTGGTTGGGSTAEEAENRAVAAAYVESLKKEGTHTRPTYINIHPVYDIPHLEEFVQAIDVYCTKKSAKNGRDWEYTVHNLSTQELNDLSTVLKRGTYGSANASIQFGKDIQGTPDQKADSFTRICISFWDTKQSTPYQGDAWFDSVVLTRADGSTYRFLLSICHG